MIMESYLIIVLYFYVIGFQIVKSFNTVKMMQSACETLW